MRDVSLYSSTETRSLATLLPRLLSVIPAASLGYVGVAAGDASWAASADSSVKRQRLFAQLKKSVESLRRRSAEAGKRNFPKNGAFVLDITWNFLFDLQALHVCPASSWPVK